MVKRCVCCGYITLDLKYFRNLFWEKCVCYE